MLAVLLWSLRDTVPSWLASRMAATVELATTNERDDARVTRAFEAAMRSQAVDAILEPLPNQTRVRHSRLTVRAPSSNEAIETGEPACRWRWQLLREGRRRPLSIDVRRRTTPVADPHNGDRRQAMSVGAAVAGLLGVLLIALGLAAPAVGPRSPAAALLVAGGWRSGARRGAVFLPGDIIMALFFMAIPVLIAGMILWKGTQLRQAASWPSTRARIVKSKICARSITASGGSDARSDNTADVEYEFTPGRSRLPRHAHRHRRYRRRPASKRRSTTISVGATVPVYYDPKNPGNALLERDAAAAARLALRHRRRCSWSWPRGRGGVLEHSAILEGLRIFPGEGLPAGRGLLHPGRAHDAGHAVGMRGARSPRHRLAATAAVSSQAPSSTIASGSVARRTGTLMTFYEPVVEYSYRVDDREYHSTQLSFGGKAAGSQAIAEARAARYPLGNEVMVRYDPKNPSNAVLDIKVAYGVTCWWWRSCSWAWRCSFPARSAERLPAPTVARLPKFSATFGG